MPSSLLYYLLIGVATVLVLYGLFIGFLFIRGRTQDARAWAGLIPDCLILFKRLASDAAVPRSRKFLIILIIGYLALPFDIVPDFIPIAGQLDDIILVILVLRSLLRSVGRDHIRDLWPGPTISIDRILKLVSRNPA